MCSLRQAASPSQVVEDLLDLRHGLGGGLFALEDRLVTPVEVARADLAHPGTDDHVGVF